MYNCNKLNINEAIRDWEIDSRGWRISPGVVWCKKGYRVKVGINCTAGDDFTAGDNATGLFNLGHADGYTKSLSSVNGVAYIGAGCRWFTLDEALAHWGDHHEDRDMTLCLLETAKAIANLKNLKGS